MNRFEFCQRLVKARENAGVGKNEQCRRTGFTFVQLQLLEAKPNNFAINKAIDYLNALDCKLAIGNNNECVYINKPLDFAVWLKSARNGKFSQRSLANEAGCTYPTIANIEGNKNTVTIDIMLKILDVLGYTVKITNK